MSQIPYRESDFPPNLTIGPNESEEDVIDKFVHGLEKNLGGSPERYYSGSTVSFTFRNKIVVTIRNLGTISGILPVHVKFPSPPNEEFNPTPYRSVTEEEWTDHEQRIVNLEKTVSELRKLGVKK
jgi:hypothetical protein